MRSSVFLLFPFCIATVLAADDKPKIEGRVSAVSPTDIQLIAGAANGWLQKMHAQNPNQRAVDKLSLIHVVDHNKAEVHMWTCSGGWNAEMRLRVRRVDGTWKADEIADVITLEGCST